MIYIVYNKFIFLDFTVANWSITSSKSVFSNVSLSTLRSARSLRRPCPIDAREYDKISFNLLKDRSQLAIETGIINKICREIRRFGKTSSPKDTIKPRRAKGVSG